MKCAKDRRWGSSKVKKPKRYRERERQRWKKETSLSLPLCVSVLRSLAAHFSGTYMDSSELPLESAIWLPRRRAA